MKNDQINSKEIEASTVPPSKLDEMHPGGLTPFLRTPELDTSRFYMGSLLTFLSTGNDTGGRTSLMIYDGVPGNEPPPDVHEWEHETYYILEGIMEFYCDGKVMLARQGELVFLPEGKAHAFFIRSPQVKLLITLHATSEHAVGLDRYFLEMSHPAESMSLPENQATYATDGPERAIAVGEKTGIKILSPEETADLLPHYPGFGARRELLKD